MNDRGWDESWKGGGGRIGKTTPQDENKTRSYVQFHSIFYIFENFAALLKTSKAICVLPKLRLIEQTKSIEFLNLLEAIDN